MVAHISTQVSLAKILEELQALFHLSPFGHRAYKWCICAVVSLALVAPVILLLFCRRELEKACSHLSESIFWVGVSIIVSFVSHAKRYQCLSFPGLSIKEIIL
jgi:hypothetical protein